jgi:hypothetical protein
MNNFVLPRRKVAKPGERGTMNNPMSEIITREQQTTLATGLVNVRERAVKRVLPIVVTYT